MGIEQQEYRQRQQELMSKIGGGTAIFRSAPMATMHNDVEYTYRQESSFYYLTGFNEPEAVAVFVPHHEEHQYILFVQPKDPEKETWTGYRTGVEAAKDAQPMNPLNAADGGLYIGSGTTLAEGTFFQGMIDDVRVYNQALSEEEIINLIE